MVKITLEDFPKIREKYNDKKIVFCSGSFDLTHAGHILFLEDCKKQGDILVVGVGCDNNLRKDKGEKRPILNEHIRLKTIDSLKVCDYCFIENLIPKNNPLDPMETYFQHLKPDVYVINEDAYDIPFRKQLIKKFNVKMIILKRTCPPEFKNISTTKIIEKINNPN